MHGFPMVYIRYTAERWFLTLHLGGQLEHNIFTSQFFNSLQSARVPFYDWPEFRRQHLIQELPLR